MFLNSSKSKIRLKLIKLGKAIMERHQHAVVQILSHLGQVWVYASHKPDLLTTSMMVSVGNVSHPCAKRHTYTAFSRLNFLHSQIRPNRSTVLNFGIIPCSFGLFYTLIEFLGI